MPSLYKGDGFVVVDDMMNSEMFDVIRVSPFSGFCC